MKTAVFGDENDHGNGKLTCDNNADKVFVNSKLVALLGCSAEKDNRDHNPSQTKPGTASSKVFVGGIAVHRENDSRVCGAKTIVTNQDKVHMG